MPSHRFRMYYVFSSIIMQKGAKQMKTGVHICNALSVVFTPLLSATYLFAIIIFFFPGLTGLDTLEEKFLAIAYIILFTTLPPVLFVTALFKMGIVSTMMLDARKDRIFPQIFTCVNYIVISVFLLNKFGTTNALTLTIISIGISTIIITVVNMFWKISTHAAGIAGICSISAALYVKHPVDNFLYPLIFICFLVVAVCSARLFIRVHTISQITAGLALGGIVGWACFFYTI